jgi:hypothetical protein
MFLPLKFHQTTLATRVQRRAGSCVSALKWGYRRMTVEKFDTGKFPETPF